MDYGGASARKSRRPKRSNLAKKKVSSEQKEMLMPIKGRKAAKEAAPKLARPQRKSA
jgi:DNA end-binding protein Ku